MIGGVKPPERIPTGLTPLPVADEGGKPGCEREWERAGIPTGAPGQEPLLSARTREVSCFIEKTAVLWYDQFNKLEFVGMGRQPMRHGLRR